MILERGRTPLYLWVQATVLLPSMSAVSLLSHRRRCPLRILVCRLPGRFLWTHRRRCPCWRCASAPDHPHGSSSRKLDGSPVAGRLRVKNGMKTLRPRRGRRTRIADGTYSRVRRTSVIRPISCGFILLLTSTLFKSWHNTLQYHNSVFTALLQLQPQRTVAFGLVAPAVITAERTHGTLLTVGRRPNSDTRPRAAVNRNRYRTVKYYWHRHTPTTGTHGDRYHGHTFRRTTCAEWIIAKPRWKKKKKKFAQSPGHDCRML